jgi:MarR family transcriptional regulator for hemolysin
MRPESSDPTFGFLVHDIARLLRKNFDRRAQRVGLTRAQWWVLFHVHRHEGCNQRFLADVLEIEPITLTRLIDRLEGAGWVERRHDAEDRRAWRLFLTDKSNPILERMFALGAETREQAMTGLKPAEREALMTVLTHIRGNLSAKENGGDVARSGADAADPAEIAHV